MELTVIKKYSSALEAEIDADLLRSRGIECAVYGENTAQVMPYLQNVVTLSVMSDHAERAIAILNNPSDEKL